MIRDMIAEDRAVFLEMAGKFYSSGAVDHAVDRSIYEASFDAAVGESPLIRAFMIEDGGRPVGFALVAFYFATEVAGLVVLIEDLYLDETCRGKGLGSKFMQFIEQEYPEAKRFHLEVAKDNTRAIDLYEKLGYKELGYVQMVKEVQ